MSGTRSAIFSCTVFSFVLFLRISLWKINSSSSNCGGFQFQRHFMKLYFNSCYHFLGHCSEKGSPPSGLKIWTFLFQNYVLENHFFLYSGYFWPLLSKSLFLCPHQRLVSYLLSSLGKGGWMEIIILLTELGWTVQRGRLGNMEMED